MQFQDLEERYNFKEISFNSLIKYSEIDPHNKHRSFRLFLNQLFEKNIPQEYLHCYNNVKYIPTEIAIALVRDHKKFDVQCKYELLDYLCRFSGISIDVFSDLSVNKLIKSDLPFKAKFDEETQEWMFSAKILVESMWGIGSYTKGKESLTNVPDRFIYIYNNGKFISLASTQLVEANESIYRNLKDGHFYVVFNGLNRYVLNSKSEKAEPYKDDIDRLAKEQFDIRINKSKSSEITTIQYQGIQKQISELDKKIDYTNKRLDQIHGKNKENKKNIEDELFNNNITNQIITGLYWHRTAKTYKHLTKYVYGCTRSDKGYGLRKKGYETHGNDDDILDYFLYIDDTSDVIKIETEFTKYLNTHFNPNNNQLFGHNHIIKDSASESYFADQVYNKNMIYEFCSKHANQYKIYEIRENVKDSLPKLKKLIFNK